MNQIHTPQICRILRRCRSTRRLDHAWRLLSRLLLCVVTFACADLLSQTKPTEYQVEAAYLYNFGKFTIFPATDAKTGNDFPVCVLGQDPFGPALDATVANATVDGRRIVVSRINSAREAGACRIVFVAKSEESRLGALLPALNSQGVLTVSDIPEFLQRGGIIQFVMDGGRVRFEVNLKAAQEAGLTLSSELLKVAVKVVR